ncbi:PorV/PorQ family protein [Rubrivirga sp.]|uniref:PorV/PorQ family protein n=1 Tax=Rubrivirga sp. TaxID=1885344 RepID=UPI003B52ADBB
MTRITTCLAVLALTLVPPASAQDNSDLEQGDFNKGGRTAFQFLKIGVGARQAALGEASVATVRDVNAAFWNPAGISGMQGPEASFSYTKWIADTQYVGAAVGGRFGAATTVALSVAALDYGDIPEAVVGPADGRTGSSVSGGNVMVGLHAARTFTDRLSIGVGAKYVHESLADYGTGTFALDVGTTYDIGARGLQLAMSAQNFAGSVRWLDEDSADRQEGYDVPLVFRIGLAGTLAGADGFVGAPAGHSLTASAEAINTNDFSERLHLGLEYTIDDFVALRGGYRLGYDEGQWSLGAGINPEVGGVQMRIDYAYVGYSFLSAPQRLSVSFAL